ncbi:MAG: hypothetical protein RQ875_03490 [Vicingaceae bacterium]|nr:hypothetical protein [Vicingaceae bacterium]
MSTLIVNIEGKDKSLLLSFIKKLKASVKEITDSEKEDIALANAMMKGKKGKYVSKDVIIKKLQK